MVGGPPGRARRPPDLRRAPAVDQLARALHLQQPMSFRPRIVVATPPTVESKALPDWLTSEGFEPIRLSNPGRLADDLSQCRLDLLIVDSTFAAVAINAVRARNPHLPVVVLGDADAAAEAQAMARGAMYLARPIQRDLLVCTVSMGIAETRPVRRSERKPTRLAVVVQGVSSQVIDVSREGLRLEIPRRVSVAPPPPLFDVHVPMLGVSLNVRRLWIASPPPSVRNATWYGGELSNNTRRVELAWHTLVDALSARRASLELR